jgi:NitT/TauT family transport system substrate-binding protein
MYIGVSKGYFEDQKLNVQWPKFSGGANSMAALIGKQADFSLQGYSHIVTAFNKGAKVKMVAILINKEHSEYVMRKQVADKRAITVDSSLEAKAKAAKGLTIGVTSRGSKSDSDIRFFLKHYGGLDPDKDVNIIVAPGDYASVKAAFERGDLDIYNKGAPAPQQLIADGLAISYLKGWADAPEGMPEGVNTILTEVAARYETIQNDPDLVQRVVNAFAKTLKFMNKSPDEVQQLLPSLFPDTSADILTAIWHDLRPVFPANPLCKPNEKGMTADQDLLIGTGVLKQPIPLENTYDDEFAEAAKV